MKFLPIVHMILSALAKPKQIVSIQETPTGRVLDIGGGGEGVIARVCGSRVVAIDRSVSEIREARAKAPDIPWLAADAAKVPCRDHSFDSATAFFSCMYMPDHVKENVFRETRRVLKPGGEFWIWDGHMASRSKVFGLRVQVDFYGNRAIRTVYGVKARDQSSASISAMLREAGFATQVLADEKHWFLIRAGTPCHESHQTPVRESSRKETEL